MDLSKIGVAWQLLASGTVATNVAKNLGGARAMRYRALAAHDVKPCDDQRWMMNGVLMA